MSRLVGALVALLMLVSCDSPVDRHSPVKPSIEVTAPDSADASSRIDVVIADFADAAWLVDRVQEVAPAVDVSVLDAPEIAPSSDVSATDLPDVPGVDVSTTDLSDVSGVDVSSADVPDVSGVDVSSADVPDVSGVDVSSADVADLAPPIDASLPDLADGTPAIDLVVPDSVDLATVDVPAPDAMDLAPADTLDTSDPPDTSPDALLVDAADLTSAIDAIADALDGGGDLDQGDADASEPFDRTATISNLKVAFYGDQGINTNARSVLQLVKDEQAAFVLHLGDIGYNEVDPQSPYNWEEQVNDILGPDYPYFLVAGNHDVAWWPQYQKLFEERLKRFSGHNCVGDHGVKSSCSYKGLFFILSGVGTLGWGHESYLAQQLKSDRSIWRICAWHKNQRDMQVGGKGDEVGWQAYQICQNAGAIIATGHEHSYSRTLTLSDVGNQSRGHGAMLPYDKITIDPGHTLVFVAGLGGIGRRDYLPLYHDDDSWWATIFANNKYVKNGVEIESFTHTYGVLFITFNVDGDPKKARAVFKAIDGQIVDEFELTANW